MKKKIFLSIAVLLVLTLTFLIPIFTKTISYFNPFFPFANYLLGIEQPTSYLILLGNDTEVRANGGFAGSYAKIILSTPSVIPDLIGNPYKLVPIFIDSRLRGNDKLAIKSEISFHDIYVPNGQLDGYVKPPDAVQQAFGHGTWQLANADYEPNFPTAATSIRWFLEKGKETNPDILTIVNLSTNKKIMNIIGSINIPEKNATITPDNLYLFLQGKVELNFFPGSTQKADILHTVGTETIKKIMSLSLYKRYQIAKIIFTDLKNQNIVVNSSNSDFQKLLKSKNFAGVYEPSSLDHFGLVELNLGANKANAFVTRHTDHQITFQNNQIKHQTNIQFQNISPEAAPNPPIHYGGNYYAFMRLYIPANATNIEINHTEQATDSANMNPNILNNQNPVIASQPLAPDLDPGNSAAIQEINSKFTTISFWHISLAGNTSQINLSYTLPIENQNNYSLTILKQNGFPTSPQTLNIFGKTLTTDLTSPFTYP